MVPGVGWTTHVGAHNFAAGAQGANKFADEGTVARAQRLVLVAGGQVLGHAPAAAGRRVGLDVQPHHAPLHVVGVQEINQGVHLRGRRLGGAGERVNIHLQHGAVNERCSNVNRWPSAHMGGHERLHANNVSRTKPWTPTHMRHATGPHVRDGGGPAPAKHLNRARRFRGQERNCSIESSGDLKEIWVSTSPAVVS